MEEVNDETDCWLVMSGENIASPQTMNRTLRVTTVRYNCNGEGISKVFQSPGKTKNIENTYHQNIPSARLSSYEKQGNGQRQHNSTCHDSSARHRNTQESGTCR